MTLLPKFADELRKAAKQALDRGDVDVAVHLSPEMAAEVARRCAGERPLIGYRVVRTNPTTGVREWWSHINGLYSLTLSLPTSQRPIATNAGDRVVRVYLRIVKRGPK